MRYHDRLRLFALIAVLSSVLLCSCGKETPVIPEDKPPQHLEPTPESEADVDWLEPLDGYIITKVQFPWGGVEYGYQNESIWLDPIRILEAYGAENASWSISDEEYHLSLEHRLELFVTRGKEYALANGRYFYLPDGALWAADRIYLPQETIEKIFGIEAIRTERGKIHFLSDQLCVVEGGKYYYDVNFSGDEIYWLSHIIQAEADNQPLAGMIGVGNVVLNRTKAEGFPDRVFDVIFDYQNAPQFTPKTSTALSRLVTEDVKIATYLCLEGYNTVGDSLFFQNPCGAETTWMSASREFVVTIGNMDFYR